MEKKVGSYLELYDILKSEIILKKDESEFKISINKADKW